MSEKIDVFSRKLASGMSRRKAFWQLLVGAGGLGLLATQKASADAAGCPTYCFQQSTEIYNDCIEDSLENNPSTPFIQILTTCLGIQGQIYDLCLTLSASCAKGKCTQGTFTDGSNGEIDLTNAKCVAI